MIAAPDTLNYYLSNTDCKVLANQKLVPFIASVMYRLFLKNPDANYFNFDPYDDAKRYSRDLTEP